MWRGATYCARAAALDLLRRFTLNPIRTSRPEPRQGRAAPCILAQKALPSVLPPEKPEPLGLWPEAALFSFHRFLQNRSPDVFDRMRMLHIRSPRCAKFEAKLLTVRWPLMSAHASMTVILGLIAQKEKAGDRPQLPKGRTAVHRLYCAEV